MMGERRVSCVLSPNLRRKTLSILGRYPERNRVSGAEKVPFLDLYSTRVIGGHIMTNLPFRDVDCMTGSGLDSRIYC